MLDRTLETLLSWMMQHRASDLFLSPGAPPSIKQDGVTRHFGELPLSTAELEAITASVMSPQQQQEFAQQLELSLALQTSPLGRFRLNFYRQRGDIALTVRFIPAQIPSLEELHLPQRLHELAMLPRGLVLITGAAGAGKSTTLAALLDHRNRCSTGHILTIEDPIEYLHQHQQSVVNQREVGMDTLSFEEALRSAMRDAPDVVMIGEIRDQDGLQHALHYAESGHLCLSSLHAGNTPQALERLLNFFPATAHPKLLSDLSSNLQAIVAQRLVPARAGGRVPAIELLLHTPYVTDLLLRGDFAQVHAAMAKGNQDGMCTFDTSLYELLQAGVIDQEQALAHADSRTDLALRIRLNTPLSAQDDGGLTLAPH